MKLLLQNLPPSLKSQQEPLERCLRAMDAALPLRAVYLFGSHVRGEAIWNIWPRPAFTLIPITPTRLAEKRACKDHFFQTVLDQGVPLATEN